MEATYYHGTTHEIDLGNVNPKSGFFDLCLVDEDDIEIAEDYIGGDDDYTEGHLYEVTLKSWAHRHKSVDDILFELEEAGFDIPEGLEFDGPCLYRLIELDGVIEILREGGVSTIAYDDWDYYGRTHDTVRVINPNAIESIEKI